MNMLNKLLSKSTSGDNLVQTCQNVLHYYGVKHTALQIRNLVHEHLEYPSLLAVMDTLVVYGVKNAAIRKGLYNYEDFECPFICSIQRPEWPESFFTLITTVDNQQIYYFDPIKNVESSISTTDFEQMDKAVVLLLDGTETKHEAGYTNNIQKQRAARILKYMPFILFSAILIYNVVYNFIIELFPLNGISSAYLLLNAFGFLIALMLIWHEVDAHNPFLKEVCGGFGGKSNCSAVLSSKGASFFGLSWSMIGFSYFATVLLFQLILGPSNSRFFPYSVLLPLLSLPYIFYSIYYQWRVVKQWCPLCLAIQVVLLLSGILSLDYFYQFGFVVPQLATGLTMLSIGIALLLAAGRAISVLKSAKESKEYEKKWKRLRYNRTIFNTLLQREEPILHQTDGLGVLVGDPKAEHEIIKVCNPYCGPCAKAHPELEELIRSNPNVKLRVIFTATGEDNDMKTLPVLHILAIQERDGMDAVKEALDDWYLAEVKDYEVFSKKYPMNGEIVRQRHKIEEMRDWCDQMKIRVTPTFYVNGYELPSSYHIGDLQVILKETT